VPFVELKGHTDSVLSVAFSPDGKKAVTGSADNTIRIWDAESGSATFGKELKRLGKTVKVFRVSVPASGHAGYVNSVAFSPDGKKIVTSSSDKTARIWDAETGRELKKLKGHTEEVIPVAFSPDGKKVVTGSFDNTARIWDAETGRELKRLEHKGAVNTYAFSLEGKQLKGHTAGVYSVAFSPDGKRVVIGNQDNTVRIWDAESGKELKKLEGHTGAVQSAAFSSDGKKVVTVGFDSTARVWDADSDSAAFGSELDMMHGYYSAAFSPDGKKVVMGDLGGDTASIWDAEAEEKLKRLDGHVGKTHAVIFSPDGEKVVIREEKKLEGRADTVRSVAFSPDGKKVIARSADNTNTARIWVLE
jgi:WD40 repeat protein